MWKLVPMLAVAGCVQLFSLGDPRKDDRDGDHVPDNIDNCPDVANPDQSDKDGNGIGDACDGCVGLGGEDSDSDGIPDACDGCDNRLPDSNGDGIPDQCQTGIVDPCPTCMPCSIGPHHDEDGDTIADGCDLCPALADANNLDTDGDGVGDACDPNPTVAVEEQIFDAFFLPNQAWLASGPWTIASDQATAGLGGTVTTNAYRTLGTGGGTFVVRTHVQPKLSPVKDTSAGVYASPMQDPSATGAIACTISQIAGGNVVLIAHDSGGTASSPPLPIDTGYTVTLAVTNTSRYDCTAAPDSSMPTKLSIVIGAPIPGPFLLGILSTGSGYASFDDYDVIAVQH